MYEEMTEKIDNNMRQIARKYPKYSCSETHFILLHIAYPLTFKSFASLISFFSDYQTDMHTYRDISHSIQLFSMITTPHHTSISHDPIYVFYMYMCTISSYCLGRNGMKWNGILCS